MIMAKLSGKSLRHTLVPVFFLITLPAQGHPQHGQDGSGSIYPPLAATLAIDGDVLLKCRISDHKAQSCAVVREAPRGFGFATASLAAASNLHLDSPETNIVYVPFGFRRTATPAARPPKVLTGYSLAVASEIVRLTPPRRPSDIILQALPGMGQLSRLNRVALEQAALSLEAEAMEVLTLTLAERLERSTPRAELKSLAAFMNQDSGRELLKILTTRPTSYRNLAVWLANHPAEAKMLLRFHYYIAVATAITKEPIPDHISAYIITNLRRELCRRISCEVYARK